MSCRNSLATLTRLFTAVALSMAMSVASAAQLPLAKAVQVQAAVQLGSGAGILCFVYTVSNPTSSTASIDELTIDISKRAGDADVSGQGVTDGPGASTDFSQTVLASGKAIPMIPVGLSAPSRWEASVAVQGTAVWTAIDSQLAPGQRISGFQMCSRGLPGVRRLTAQPYVDVDTLSLVPPNGTPADLQRYKAQLEAIEEAAGTTGLTAGPVGPPLDFKTGDFVQAIISYKEQAIQQGWIKNQGIGISLDAKLNAASASLARGDNKTAINQLSALLNEVDAEAEKQLSSEAVALLKFNTQFLISKIQ